jgi:hypothetical protein
VRALAAPAEPSDRADDEFDFMNFLNRRGLHDLDHEKWNVYGQLTWISSFKLPFQAPYTNLNGSNKSLLPSFEHSFTGSATLYVGVMPWQGTELYWAPEMISERPLSGLSGLGGVIQNFELEKGGTPAPQVYDSRLYLRQTLELAGEHGGERDHLVSNPMQLGTTYAHRRLVLTVGNFSVLDLFDKNSYAGDLRRQLFNMAFLTYAAYDFAADAHGYTWGAVAELDWDDWALRIGRAVVPKDPNQLALDFHFWRFYGDQLELEHDHTLAGLPGAVRLLGYRNVEDMARFDDAIAAFRANPAENAAACTSFNYGSKNATAPDLCWARRPNTKMGIGLNVEQAVAPDMGLFLRAMYSDGQSEVYSFTATDRSVSVGALAHGVRWNRPDDYLGFGVGAGWISRAHADYLRLGGVDGFIGDGAINPSTEGVVDAFYGANLDSSIWLSADYQFIFHPAFNADRGPVHVLGARLHAEF